MSVNFFVAGGPTQDVQETDWDCVPMFNEDNTPVMRKIGILPEIELSNTNAQLLLNVLGLVMPEAWAGEFKTEQLADLRQRIIYALNTDVAAFERPASDTGGNPTVLPDDGSGVIKLSRQMRVVEFGMNADKIRRNLESLMRVVLSAQENNLPIVFA